MITFHIPGLPGLQIQHLVLDFNGTLAADGQLLDGVAPLLLQLSERLSIHVITADTFGNVEGSLSDIPCRVFVIEANQQDMAKLDYITGLDPARVCAIGNGHNDELMVRQAGLGIAVIGPEGAWVPTLLAAKIVVTDIRKGLELLLNHLRLAATMRR
jgi:soluble P-type ATPase